MRAFEKVIGYESIKSELMQICDMLHNKSRYEFLGAKLPNGALLYGAPGLGKSLLAKSFIEESGLNFFTIRRNQGSDKFVEKITEVFEEAKQNAPCIIFLDDMDKFANEDDSHRDAKEYVAIQAGIDEVKDSGVFVLATVNDINKLPDSLLRCGRFDRKIEVLIPTQEDSYEIIKHFLKNKRISDHINLDDITKMIRYNSCAELETVLNEAAINAGYAKRDSISMNDIIKAVLRMEYNSPDTYTKTSYEDLRKVAVHEAGHLVACEVLSPGSVGLSSIRANSSGDKVGFINKCKELDNRRHHIIVSLAGKVATELYYSETCANGCYSDIRKAYNEIRAGLANNGTCGLGMIDISSWKFEMSENMSARNEAVVHAELEKYMFKTRDILLKNKEFLEKTIEALLEKETLLHSDIKAIRESVKITSVAA